MTNRLELNWKLDGFVDEQRYYCSETPMDPLALPAPKILLAGDVRTYSDTDIVVGKTYYVRVSSVKNGIEKVGSEVKVFADFDLINQYFGLKSGYYFNSNYMETLWQDIAGTIPANVGSIVRRIDNLCKLPGVPAYAYATSDSKSAILRNDADGNYLEFSGGQSYVVESVNISSKNVSFFYGMQTENITSTSIVFESSSSAYNVSNPYALLSLIDGGRATAYGSGTSTVSGSMIASSPVSSGVYNYIIGSLNQDESRSSIKINGATSVNAVAYRGAPGNFRTYNHYWGSRNNSGIYISGKLRLFGLTFNELSVSETSVFEQTLSKYA